jgi:hypothetical protein
MPRFFIKFLAVAVFIYLGICVGLYAAQRSLIYHPTPSLGADSAASKLKLAVEGAELAISVSPQKGECVDLFWRQHGGCFVEFASVFQDVSRLRHLLTALSRL